MSVWFPDVYERHEAENATRIGMMGALGFAVMVMIGIAVFYFTGGGPGGTELDPAAYYAGLAFAGGELVLALATAYRFYLKKGRFIGIVALSVYSIELAFKLMSGFLGIFWYLIHFAIFMALLNGIRGAWALRDAPDLDPDEIAQAFE